MTRLIPLLAFAIALSSCANKPVANLPKPVIKSIALIPATTPKEFTLDNRNAAIGVLIPGAAFFAYRAENKKKARILNEKLAAAKYSPGQPFAESMAAALRQQGYEVTVLENVFRKPTDPDSIDYEKLSYTADAVVHLYFSEIGLYSGPVELNYLPRVNASGIVYIKGRSKYLYDETIYYGVDAKEGKDWAIFADKKFAYPDFESIINNFDSVLLAFNTGIQEITTRMAGQIHAAVK